MSEQPNPVAQQLSQQGTPQNRPQQHQQQGGFPHQQPQPTMNAEPEALRNLIVNYIPTTVDENQLRQLFEHYGPIENVKIVTNRETKQSRGFGFVKYQYSMSAYNAINCLNSYPLMNKRLKVAYAKEAEAAQAQMYNPMAMGGMSMGMGMGMYGMPTMGQQMMGGQQRQQRPPRQYNNMQGGNMNMGMNNMNMHMNNNPAPHSTGPAAPLQPQQIAPAHQ